MKAKCRGKAIAKAIYELNAIGSFSVQEMDSGKLSEVNYNLLFSNINNDLAKANYWQMSRSSLRIKNLIKIIFKRFCIKKFEEKKNIFDKTKDPAFMIIHAEEKLVMPQNQSFGPNETDCIVNGLDPIQGQGSLDALQDGSKRSFADCKSHHTTLDGPSSVEVLCPNDIYNLRLKCGLSSFKREEENEPMRNKVVPAEEHMSPSFQDELKMFIKKTIRETLEDFFGRGKR